MRMVYCLTALLIAAVPQAGMAEQATGPGDTVATFHQALASGEREKVLEMLSPELIIFEDSGLEASRSEYASHHLGADMKFSAEATRKILTQTIRKGNDISWVMTQYSVKGKAGGKRIKLKSAETIVLERTSDGWLIAHIHWSNKLL